MASYPIWPLPPATTTTTLWGRITGYSNFDWQVSADMGPVGWLVNDADPNIHLGDGLKIVMETWPESDVYVDGWVHSEPNINAYTPFDNDYSLKQTVANEQPGTYSGTITFTCVNMIDGGTCGDAVCDAGENTLTCPVDCPEICGNGVMEGIEECDDGNTATGDGCSSICTLEITCGNGVIEGAEACDDGNTIAGDGCSPA